MSFQGLCAVTILGNQALFYSQKLESCTMDPLYPALHTVAIATCKCQHPMLHCICLPSISRHAFKENYYRPPTKLWEGNVFIGVCHSVHGGGRAIPPWLDKREVTSYWNAFLLEITIIPAVTNLLIFCPDSQHITLNGWPLWII